jgi:fanconi-associated nuclease 1
VRKLTTRFHLAYTDSCRSVQITQPLLPLILAHTKKSSPSHRHYPEYRHIRTPDIFPSREALLAYEAAIVIECQMDDAFNELGRVEGAQRGAALFRPAHARWQKLLEEESTASRPGALSRFDEGHVLTRIVYKGAECFSVLKELNEEMVILKELLGQKKWRTGRRG